MQWLRRIFHRQRRYNDLHESIQEHLEEKIDDLMEEGMSREDAEFAAPREFGNVALLEERSREVWQWSMLETFWADLRFAFRQLRKSPRFTIAAITTLAIGIGATATVYSVVHAVLIDPYPYRGADRMVHLHLYDKEPIPNDLALTGPQFAEFQKSPVLDGSIADDGFNMAVTGEDLPEQVLASRMSPNAFQYFGVPALLGRTFTSSDSNKVAVLSYHYWKSHYASRTDILGKPIQIDHENYIILGVLPQRFAWSGSDLYIPLPYSSDPRRMITVYARIKRGVSYHAAEQALQPLLNAFAKETPDNFPQNFKVHLVRINDIAVGRFRGVLIVLFLSVSFLLLLACVNVAILLLARGESRQPEIAMRKALGANRFRIMSQLLTESLVLSSTGGFWGILIAIAGIRLVRAHLPQSVFPAEAVIALNLPVLLFSLGVSMLTGIAASLWPALRLSNAHLHRAANAGSHKLAGQKGVQRSHMILLACQTAITVLLLTSAGATLRQFSKLLHANLGYDPHNLASINLSLREGSYEHWEDRINYYAQIRKKVASNADVLSAAIAESNLPPTIWNLTQLAVPGLKTSSGQNVDAQGVSSEYFSTLRIPLLHGRLWTSTEMTHAASLVLINKALQRRYWPNSNPIGQTIILNHGIIDENAWTAIAPGKHGRYQIIGIVGDSPNQGLDEEIVPAVYFPYTVQPYVWFNLMIRTRGDTSALLHTIQEQVHSINANQAVGDIVAATDLLERDTLGRERFVAGLFAAFALLALAFAASGLYSIQSYLVSQRTKEFGLRIALGARRHHIAQLVTQSSGIAVLVGIGTGLLANFAFSQLFSHWTNGNVRDPALLGIVIPVLLVAVGLASLAPAWVAVSIDPMEALRAE